MLLGLDDTDTRSGGCTTHVGLQLAYAIQTATGVLAEWSLIDTPRLVRLNPAAPHKTRGNGAIVLPVGPGGGTARPVGIWGGQPLVAKASAPARAPTDDEVEALVALTDQYLPPCGDRGADPQPGAVLLATQPPPTIYAHAVSQLVAPYPPDRPLPGGAIRLTPRGRRGEIGALAACAWPQDHVTFESIAYRNVRETSAARALPHSFARLVAQMHGGFDNLDPSTGRLRCVPRTPCPVRWGLRGHDPEIVAKTSHALGARDAWTLATNHASNDHARHAATHPLPWSVVKGDATIGARPERGPGGHLVIQATWANHGSIGLAFFEPTKSLRQYADALLPGDEVTVLGRCGPAASTVAVEAFRVNRCAPRVRIGPNPRCQRCDRSMKSRGAAQPFRCSSCHAQAARTERVMHALPGPAVALWHQVPDHVRGHLLAPAAWHRLHDDIALDAAAPLAHQAVA